MRASWLAVTGCLPSREVPFRVWQTDHVQPLCPRFRARVLARHNIPTRDWRGRTRRCALSKSPHSPHPVTSRDRVSTPFPCHVGCPPYTKADLGPLRWAPQAPRFQNRVERTVGSGWAPRRAEFHPLWPSDSSRPETALTVACVATTIVMSLL